MSWRRKLALWCIVFAVAWAVSVSLVLSTAHGQSLLDFYSPYCGPCQSMAPIVDSLNQSGVQVQRIDTTQQQRVAQQYRIDRIPAFVAIDANGREVGRIVGTATRESLVALYDRAAKLAPASSIAASSCIITARVAGSPSETWRGTGTLVEKDSIGVVLTCYHTFRDSQPPYVIEFPNGGSYGATMLGCDENVELALLAIQPPTESPIAISPDDPSGTLTAGGFGGGQWRVVTGSLGPREQSTYNRSVYWYTMYGGDVRSGDSGGPVVNSAGQLVGVLWGTANQQVRFCGGPYLRQFLDRCRQARQQVGQRNATASEPRQQQVGPSTYQQGAAGPQPVDPSPAADTGSIGGWLRQIDADIDRLDKVKEDRANVAKLREETVSAGAELLKGRESDQAETKSALDALRQSVGEAKEAAVSQAMAGAKEYADKAKADARHRIAEARTEILSNLPAAADTAIQFTLRNVLIAAGVGTGGAGVAAWIGGKLAARGIRKAIERHNASTNEPAEGGRARILTFPSWRARTTSRPAAKESEGAASTAGSFPGSSAVGGDGASADVRLYQPVERDLSEGEQLLQLERLEGLDPLQDAIAGGTFRRRLKAIADSGSDSQKAEWAKQLLSEVDQRFNEIAPTSFKPATK